MCRALTVRAHFFFYGAKMMQTKQKQSDSTKYPHITWVKIQQLAKAAARRKQPHVAIYWLGVDVAADLLNANIEQNRKPHDWPSLVRAHARGEFGPSPDAIAVDTMCRLFNGQNRLRALLKAHAADPRVTGFAQLVAVGMEPTSRVVTDGGQPRKAHQVAKLMGIGMTAGDEIACRRAMQGYGIRSKYGNDEVVRFFTRHRGNVRLVMNNTPRSRAKTPIFRFHEAISNDLRAVLIRARVHNGRKFPVSSLEKFCDILRTGITDGSALQDMVCNYGNTMKVFKLEGGRQELYALTDKTLRWWIDETPPDAFPTRLWRPERGRRRELAPATLEFLGGQLVEGKYIESFPIDPLN